MSFRNISAWSIRNPVPPLVLFVALTLAGILSFMTMDVNNQPDISFPAATVSVAQPGAAPTELETQVTQRVEAAIRGISGVDQLESTVSEGQSTTFVQFTIGTPVDRAITDVREAVSQIRSSLPEGILEPQISRVDIDGDSIAYMSVEAVDMTLEELSWFVDNTIARRLLGISGMAAVNRGGGVSREIRVILDPVTLQAQGITAAQVNAQLRQVNINSAGGRAEIAGAEQSVRVLGNAADVYALAAKQIAVGAGRTVRLGDIAQVRDSFAEQRSLSRMNGRQVLSFSIEKAKGYSDVTVYNEMQAALKEISAKNPKIRFTELYSSVHYTKAQYKSALHAMLEGAALAVLVVFLFLRDGRATMISALAIPLSAIPTFFIMDLLGFNLNNMTLLALSLVAGVLVDDAIVEIENIVRHMKMGKSAFQASIDAADEIGLAVVATTFSIVAVFLPVGFMPGIAGQFFKNFGLTVVAAVLMSLLVARMLTPMLAAYFLKPHHDEAPKPDSWAMQRFLATLDWTLDNRWKTMGVGLLAFIATIFAFTTLPFQFSPPENTNFSRVQIQMVPGTTLAQTQAVVDRAADILRQEPDVAAAFENVQIGTGRIFLTLREERDRTSTEFERAVAPKLTGIADARVTFQSGGSGGRALSMVLASDDPVKLQEVANAVVTQMATIPEVRAPRVEGDLPRPEIIIRPRFDLAADLGVTTTALSQTIRIATLGDIEQNSAKYSLSDRQIPIRVSIAESARQNLATIENLPVPTATGGSVPLKVVAEIGFGEGPSQIRRLNQTRRLMITGDVTPGAIANEVMKKVDALPAMLNLPTGVGKPAYGEAKWQQEMAINFAIAVVVGVLCVFAVLVLLYKRIMPPFVNMGSLLLAPLGGALALHIAGMTLSLPVLIGLLMLLGIVAKNSILLVDFAIEEMSKGVDRRTAILDAGHKRAQPIVMTTVAMVAGMIPVALSLSGDGSFRAPMGVVVIGGLILSTLLTLLIVPAGFSLADGFERRIGPWLARKLTNGGEDGHPQRPQHDPVAAE